MLKDRILGGLKGAAFWVGVPMLSILMLFLVGYIGIVLSFYAKYLILPFPLFALVGFYRGFTKGQ
jgi:hypothetical protein